eukprot:6176723-Pleurochrysis_carterae.AAC.4
MKLSPIPPGVRSVRTANKHNKLEQLRGTFCEIQSSTAAATLRANSQRLEGPIKSRTRAVVRRHPLIGVRAPPHSTSSRRTKRCGNQHRAVRCLASTAPGKGRARVRANVRVRGRARVRVWIRDEVWLKLKKD